MFILFTASTLSVGVYVCVCRWVCAKSGCDAIQTVCVHVRVGGWGIERGCLGVSVGVAYAHVCIPQKASANFYCGSASSQPCVHNDAIVIVESVQLVLSAVDSQVLLILFEVPICS